MCQDLLLTDFTWEIIERIVLPFNCSELIFLKMNTLSGGRREAVSKSKMAGVFFEYWLS